MERVHGKPRGLFLLEMRFLTSAESRAAPAKRRSTAAPCWRQDGLSACPVLLSPSPQNLAGGHGQALPCEHSELCLFPVFSVTFPFQFWGLGGLGHLLPAPLQELLGFLGPGFSSPGCS